MSTESEGAVFLQQQMVAITNQLSIPLVEVSLVLQKYAKSLRTELERYAKQNGEDLPDAILRPLPLEVGESETPTISIDPERVVQMTDFDRMDIFDTVIRTAINEKSTPLFDALLVIRDWEKIVRNQLASATTVGQLYSPIQLPEGY